MLYLLPENDTLQHICLEMRDYKDKTEEELLEIIRELEEQLASRSLPTDPCPDEEPERFREKYGKEILEAIPDMLTVFDRNLDYIELLSSPDTNHVEGLSGKDKSHPNLKDIVPESEYRKIRANMEKVVRTGFPSIGEHSLQFEGEMHHYENLVCPLGDKYLLCMCRDVTSRENAQRELAAARVKAEESDRLKSAFLANMSHEIRTPLNAIVGFSRLVIDPGHDGDKDDYCNIIEQNSELLLCLFNDILDLSAMEAGSLGFVKEKVNVYAACLEEYERHRMKVNKGVKLALDDVDKNLYVIGDRMRIMQVLMNLLSNAAKFTPSGEIHFGYQLRGNVVQFYVKDTGIGIPSSEQKKLFKIHFRGSNAINSKVTGSGIGLLLVWKLVHLHKGKINFTSTEGKGSCIKVTFPKGEKPYRKAIHSPKPGSEKVAYAESGVPKNVTPNIAYDATKQKQQQNSDLPKILIVEDNDELREYLRNTLSDDYNIQVCSDGKQALEIVKEYMPNMIISDIMMPEMRGDELCHVLKNDIETSHIPIILLTALNNDRNIIEGLKTGADEYIVKPFNIGILRATISNILTNRSLLRHKYANLELNDDEDATTCTNCSTDLDWKFISSVKKHVEENMDNGALNVEMLCSLLNMSRTSFYNKIKALTDQAPADYIRLIRLKRAAQLLKEQKYSITEVAEMTGFSDAKYFREVFKKHFSVSPSQYAKQKEEGEEGE